jgi:hypothetical protein
MDVGRWLPSGRPKSRRRAAPARPGRSGPVGLRGCAWRPEAARGAGLAAAGSGPGCARRTPGRGGLARQSAARGGEDASVLRVSLANGTRTGCGAGSASRRLRDQCRARRSASRCGADGTNEQAVRAERPGPGQHHLLSPAPIRMIRPEPPVRPAQPFAARSPSGWLETYDNVVRELAGTATTSTPA